MLSSEAINKIDKTTIDATDLEAMIGRDVGISDWALIDQEKINAFAEVTYDPYFIHTDPARAEKENSVRGHNRPRLSDSLNAVRDGL